MNSEETVAIKISANSENFDNKKSIQREIDIYERLKYVDSPHLIKVFDVFHHENSYAIVMEYANEGSLWELVGGDSVLEDSNHLILDEKTVKGLMLEILDGLSTLHKHDIVHRDLKPHNILRLDDVWKIADFGISKRTNKPVTGFTFQGAHSAPWAAPEQIAGVEAHTSADIYSMGQILHFLLTGREKIQELNALPIKWQKIVINCIDYDPNKRMSSSELISRIQDLEL